jgi:MFS family permease
MNNVFSKIWNNPDFLRLWSGETISRLGSQITSFSIPMLAALTLHATPLQMGYLGTSLYLPHLITPLFAGVWIDHHQRKPILIAANMIRALLIGSIPVMAWVGKIQIEYLYIVCFLMGIAQVIFELAYHSYFPTIVERDKLIEANSKLMASISFAEIGGPALAGFLVQWITAPFALIVDSLSFLVSVFTTASIQKAEPEFVASMTFKSFMANIKDGFQIVLRIPHLRALVGEASTFNLFAMIQMTVFTLYATRELGLDPVTIGLISTIASIGSLAGATLSDKAAKHFGLGKAMFGSFLLASIPHLLLLLVNDTRYFNIVVLTLSFLLTGVGISVSQVFVWSIRQSLTPTGKLGRANAAYRFFVAGITPIGAMIGGYLGETVGLRMTINISAIGILLILPWIIFSPLTSLEELPGQAASKEYSIPEGAPAD